MNVSIDVPWEVGIAAPGTEDWVVFVVLDDVSYYSPEKARALAAALIEAANKADTQNGGPT